MSTRALTAPGGGLRRAGWAAAALAAISVLTALGWGMVHPATVPSASVVGRPAPDLTVRTLDGHEVQLSAFRGRPVVLNFWASWCAPCRQEEGPLKDAARRWQGTVQFVGVDFKDSPQAAQAYQEQARYPYPIGPAVNGVPGAYGVTAPPETFFIDSQGVVVARFTGPLDRQSIDRYLQLTGVRT